jgi:hypothetical protein
MSQFHPIPRFAAVIVNGAYRQYSGHPAPPGWSAQVDPTRTFALVESNAVGRAESCSQL